MPLLKESDRTALKEELGKLTDPVRILFFTQALDCETCGITKQIVEEVASLNEKIEVKTFNFAIDREAVKTYHVARIPAIAVLRMEEHKNAEGQAELQERDYGIRFYGVPSGYEFMVLISDILDVSRGDSGLSKESKELLSRLDKPVHLQVFTTPT